MNLKRCSKVAETYNFLRIFSLVIYPLNQKSSSDYILEMKPFHLYISYLSPILLLYQLTSAFILYMLIFNIILASENGLLIHISQDRSCNHPQWLCNSVSIYKWWEVYSPDQSLYSVGSSGGGQSHDHQGLSSDHELP